MATYEYFHNQGYLQIHAPVLTPSDCEGGGEAFTLARVDEKKAEFFGGPMHLTVSSQLYAEVGTAAFNKVYVANWFPE
jgi:asparaginyl-tRNA synthetase